MSDGIGTPNVTEEGVQYIHPSGITSGAAFGRPRASDGTFIIPGPPTLGLYDLGDRFPRNDTCIFANAYDVIYTSKTDGSEDALEFKIPANDPCRASITEQSKISIPSENRYWYVQWIDDGSSASGILETTVHCEAPHYQLRGPQVYDINRQNMSASAAISNILVKSGWSLGVSQAPQLRSFTVDHANVLECLQNVLSAWGGEIKYDENNKTVSLYRFWGQRTNALISWQKNLQAVQRRVDTSTVVDVVICEGNQNGTHGPVISGACIPNDIPSPSGKLRVAYISNTDLLTSPDAFAYATEQGAAMNARFVTYSATATDLSFLAGYETEGIKLGDWVTIVDPELNIDASVRVVERAYNVLEPWKSQYQFSNILPIFTTDAPPQNFPGANQTSSASSCSSGMQINARQAAVYASALASLSQQCDPEDLALFREINDLTTRLYTQITWIQVGLERIGQVANKSITICTHNKEGISSNSAGGPCSQNTADQSVGMRLSVSGSVGSTVGGSQARIMNYVNSAPTPGFTALAVVNVPVAPISQGGSACDTDLISLIQGASVEQDLAPGIILMNHTLGCINDVQQEILDIINRLVWSFNEGPGDTCACEVARALKHRLKSSLLAFLGFLSCLASNSKVTIQNNPPTDTSNPNPNGEAGQPCGDGGTTDANGNCVGGAPTDGQPAVFADPPECIPSDPTTPEYVAAYSYQQFNGVTLPPCDEPTTPDDPPNSDPGGTAGEAPPPSELHGTHGDMPKGDDPGEITGTRGPGDSNGEVADLQQPCQPGLFDPTQIDPSSGLVPLPPCVTPDSPVGQLYNDLAQNAAIVAQGCSSCCDIVVDGAGGSPGTFATLAEAFSFIQGSIAEGRSLTICLAQGGTNINAFTGLTWSGSLTIVGVGVGEHGT